MLFRILTAGLIVFSAFAIAGWIVSPVNFGATTVAPKGDRQAAAVETSRASPEPSEPPEALAGSKRVRTTTIHRPAEGSVEMAALTPQTAAPTPQPVPSALPALRPSMRDEKYDPRKPFRCPRGTPEASAPPTSAQIAQIASALRLSPEQDKHWRPVERALLEIAKHFESPEKDERRTKALLSVERMQQIYWMAGPLVMKLREEQKRDARHLACALGLTALAALI